MFALALLLACNANKRTDVHVMSAAFFARQYAARNIRAQAAGNDCAVLVVECPILLEPSTVEALHYGAGGYELYRGGVRQFAEDRDFRGVAYRDVTGRVWKYGTVSDGDLTPCR